MKNQVIVSDLFSKYLNDQCTPQEKAILFSSFDNPHSEQILRSLIQNELANMNSVDDYNLDSDAVIKRVKNQLLEIVNNNESQRIKFKVPYWLRVAALWFLSLGAGAFLINHFFNELRSMFDPVKNITLTAKPGEHKFIVLSDDSKIWLSPSSSLSYPDQFNGNLREVKLEGEAFFQIAKDKKHPFIIHTGQMSTRVVGTSFEIDAYKNQREFLVTVVTGIVKVSLPAIDGNKNQEVILKPEQRSIFTRADGKLSAEQFSQANQSLLKKTGIISSRNLTVSELVNKLSEYYNIPIQLINVPTSSICYGDFDTTKPLQILLKQIAISINAEVTFSGKVYSISGVDEKKE